MTYVTHDPPGAPPPPRRGRSRALLASGAVAGALVLVVAVTAIILATRDPAPVDRSSPAAAGASSAVTTPTPQAVAEPRVSALLAKLGCGGAVIGTQLYSRETGRCTMNGGDVTLAVFDSDALRDQWVGAARQYGGNFATGPRWAVMADSPDAAGTVAQKLGGKRL